MIKYKSRWQQIESVEVDRETESCVWIKGFKHSKVTDYECYHDTPDQAKAWIILQAQKQVTAAERQLRYVQEKLLKAQNAQLDSNLIHS